MGQKLGHRRRLYSAFLQKRDMTFFKVTATVLLTGLTPLLFFLGLSQTSLFAESENPLLFYASFDRDPVADQAFGEESPLANQNLKVVREGRRGGALQLDSDSLISYDAPGNVYAERGTISLWWELEEPLDRVPFSIVRISYAQCSAPDFTFAELQWSGERLRLWFRDRDSNIHAVSANEQGRITAGRWYHLAFTWEELEGIRLYLDGRQVAGEKAELHLAASLDQVGIHTSALSPMQARGNGRKAYIDEFRIFGLALSEKSIEDLNHEGVGRAGSMPPVVESSPELWKTHWRSRFAWNNLEAIPKINTSSLIHKLAILEGTDLGKPSIGGFDGRSGTWWPNEYPGYPEAGKGLVLKLAEEPFNLLTLQGNMVGRFNSGTSFQRVLFENSASLGTDVYFPLKTPQTLSSVQIQRNSGIVRELSFFLIQGQPTVAGSAPASGKGPSSRISYRLLPRSQAADLPGVSRSQVSTLYNLDLKIARRYLGPDRGSWVGVPSEVYKAPGTLLKPGPGPHYAHVILPPFLQHTSLDAVKLRLNLENRKLSEEAVVNVSIRDPVLHGRDLLSVDFRVPADGVSEVILDFPDIVMLAGTPLWLTFASDQNDFADNFLTGAEVEMWLSETGTGPQAERSKREYLTQRLNLIQDDFQVLSQNRLWMVPDQGKARRQFRRVDELYTLIDEVLRADPKEPTALAYRGWIKWKEAPPDFKKPENPSPDAPLWAFQQQSLVNQFKQIVDWWIKNRQIRTGEFGDGISQDTALVANWPGVTLMEGPVDGVRNSILSLLEACYRQGTLKNGLNALPADPVVAYQQGIALPALGSVLDYGNPILVEHLMETARQYERLTALNQVQHRHFRSLLFSATELLEEALYAREDSRSALLWQPGLFLAWYNGNPNLIRLMTEYADSMLSHWQKERYPLLTRGVRSFNDASLSRGLPEPEMVDFFWGIYRLTGNSKYLWLLDRLAQSGDIGLVENVSGRWLESVDTETYRAAVQDQVRNRTIWDHNLQGDESGLLARQFAYELSADKKLVEDYQAALLKHLAQNAALYTTIQPATGSVRLPFRALQRARLGGVACYDGNLFPGLVASWEGGRGNVTALVAKATPHELKIVAFNMAKTFQDVNLRIWELENGTYDVFEGTDLNDDDQADIITTRRTLPLKRYSVVPLTLRPRRTTIIEIKQAQKGTPIWELPDLAISAEDLQFDPINERGQLVIHNIGSKKSPAFTLEVENEKREILLKKQLDGIDAPVDFLPKKTVVDLSGLHLLGARTLFFKVNPERAFEEITEENNLLRRTF
jgi:hypothetical protein